MIVNEKEYLVLDEGLQGKLLILKNPEVTMVHGYHMYPEGKIHEYLQQFSEGLNIQPYDVVASALDGTPFYIKDEKATLLSLAEYQHFRVKVPEIVIDKPWWLLTPRTMLETSECFGESAVVYPDGTISFVFNNYGEDEIYVRPVFWYKGEENGQNSYNIESTDETEVGTSSSAQN